MCKYIKIHQPRSLNLRLNVVEYIKYLPTSAIFSVFKILRLNINEIVKKKIYKPKLYSLHTA